MKQITPRDVDDDSGTGNVRNTDEDWIKIGSDDPYWGVFSSERFRKAKIQEADIDALYRTGREEVSRLVEQTTSFLGAWPEPQCALDFGCGVGRLTIAMLRWARTVTGVDISPGMLDAARRRAGGDPSVQFTAKIPAQLFDWINSYIVFQHIPPCRGLAILDTLLDRLAPHGIATLHFTLYREKHLQLPSPRRRTGVIAALRRLLRPDGNTPTPVGAIHMYDYSFNEIFRRLAAHGIASVLLIHTNHGDGHHGAYIIGRKTNFLQAS